MGLSRNCEDWKVGAGRTDCMMIVVVVDKMRKKIEKHQLGIELFNLIFQIIFQKNLD